MFYSCRADQNDTKTPFSFFLESDAETEQEVIDLRGSRVAVCRQQIGSLATIKPEKEFSQRHLRFSMHPGKSGILCAVLSEQVSFLRLSLIQQSVNSDRAQIS